METQTRTIAKTISWRIVGTLITSGVVWQVTGKAELGLSVASLDCLVKLVTYYLHERLWNSVSFGYQNDCKKTTSSVDFDPVAAATPALSKITIASGN